MEITLVGAVAYWGFNAIAEPIGRVALAIVAAVAIIVVWGILLAPRAARRLPLVPRLGFEAVLFALGAIALVVSGGLEAAAVFVAAVVARFVLGVATGIDAHGL